jgi:nucleoside-triphosphatase THEP1
MKPKVYILSRPVRTGKTTELTDWVKNKNVAGVLMPDENERRQLLNLQSREVFNIQVLEANDNTVTVGHFHFDKTIFERANEILLEAVERNPDWIIIDEVGKLEIEKGVGLEPAVSEVIMHYNGKLLLVVRDSLLEKAIIHYRLIEPVIVHNLKTLL